MFDCPLYCSAFKSQTIHSKNEFVPNYNHLLLPGNEKEVQKDQQLNREIMC